MSTEMGGFHRLSMDVHGYPWTMDVYGPCPGTNEHPTGLPRFGSGSAPVRSVLVRSGSSSFWFVPALVQFQFRLAFFLSKINIPEPTLWGLMADWSCMKHVCDTGHPEAPGLDRFLDSWRSELLRLHAVNAVLHLHPKVAPPKLCVDYVFKKNVAY